jgi:ClpP class serine protease
MTLAYPHIADQLFGRAHAIDPAAFFAIMEGPVGRRVLAGERIDVAESRAASRMLRDERMAAISDARPVRSDDGMAEYALTGDGIAVISIAGALSRRFDFLAALCGFTTYDGLSATLDAACADPRVRALLFDVSSPGGTSDALLDLADKILGLRSAMPVWAVANSVAASAAYALAGSASKLYLPRLGVVGSIGAVMVHVDQSQRDAAQGLKYTAKYSGSQKNNGWEHAPLTPDAESWMQQRVDHCRQSLAELIDRQGRITAAQALATEAAVYSDAAAVEAGLADGVASFDEVLAELSEFVSSNSN